MEIITTLGDSSYSGPQFDDNYTNVYIAAGVVLFLCISGCFFVRRSRFCSINKHTINKDNEKKFLDV